MAPLVSLAELKTYLGNLQGNVDDHLLASAASNASIMVERDTGRIFAVTSNVRRVYSTNGDAVLTIHDRPVTDTTRTVALNGVNLTETEGFWLLPDWRDNLTSSQVQLRPFDLTGEWYKVDPNWFFKNLDHYPYTRGAPNDLVITGTEGHPVLPLDVFEWTRRLAAFLYWQAKGGASGFVQSPEGQEFDLSQDRPPGYERFVRDWTLRTAVAAV